MAITALPLALEDWNRDCICGYYGSNYGSLLNSREVSGDVYTTQTLSVEYSYRTKKWLEWGIQAFYAGKYQRTYIRTTGEVSYTESNHYYGLMPTVRLSWLNRPSVRLYSSLGLGLAVRSKREMSGYNDVYAMPSAQLTWIGISVGRKVFGFCELITVGTNGLFTIGAGYRFND